MERAFACICSKAVIARALAFLRSLEDMVALTDAACYVLCLDEQTPALIKRHTKSPNILPLTMTDLPEVQPFAKRHISQYAFACKPFLLRKMLTQLGVRQAIYMDADTWLVGDPSFLWAELTHHSVLLVPVIINPAVTLERWEYAISGAQRTGYYNAGFIGCNRDSLPFLDWWANRCAYSTGNNFYEDIFADQKYLNWTPALFDGVKVLRHRGLNVKNFSVQQAVFERHADGRATLSGDPIVYFHFSQNLGNLSHFPPELYPEVSRYLIALERARIDTDHPYVDMSQRDNADLKRPLLPRTGRIARLIALHEQFGAMTVEIKQRWRSWLARLSEARFLRELEGWKLAGDAPVNHYAQIMAQISDGPVVCLGVSRLTYYMARRGQPVTVYDPFQGQFNEAVQSLFNSQFAEAQALCAHLGLSERLTMRRVGLDRAAISGEAVCVIISTRFMPDVWLSTLRRLQTEGQIKQVIALYDPAWPDEYRADCRQQLEALIAVNGKAINTADVYTVS